MRDERQMAGVDLDARRPLDQRGNARIHPGLSYHCASVRVADENRRAVVQRERAARTRNVIGQRGERIPRPTVRAAPRRARRLAWV